MGLKRYWNLEMIYLLTLKTNLLPHQAECVNKLSKIKVGALYMEMGTGKTRAALELINKRLIDNKVNYIVWLCPCSVKNNLKLDIVRHIGGMPDNLRIEGIESLSSSIKLNCELLELVQSKNCYLVVDESNLVKNHKAKRSQNIERLASNCQYKLILNGTPIARNEADLFWQWYILDWRILGYKSFWSFEANHIAYDDYGKIIKIRNVDHITRKIAPYSCQAKKRDVLSLPNKKYSNKYFNMEIEQDEHYDEVAGTYLLNVDEVKPETIYRLFTALQHVLSGKRLVNKYEEKIKTVKMFDSPNDNPRVKALMDVITQDKTIIFCKYTDEIKDISKVLSEKYGHEKVVEFYGEVSLKNRNKAIEKFKEEADYFIANKACAGYGLNLQFCNNVIYYSNDWDFATRQQSEDRVHRMGQDNEVDIIDITSIGTLDERIIDCLNRKEKLSDSFKYYLDKFKDIGDRRDWISGKNIQKPKRVRCSDGKV